MMPVLEDGSFHILIFLPISYIELMLWMYVIIIIIIIIIIVVVVVVIIIIIVIHIPHFTIF